MSISVDFSAFLQPSLYGDGTWFDYVTWGAAWTLGLAISSFLLALALGTIIGTLRSTKLLPLRYLAIGWIELFRNIPLIVQMFIWYYVIPELIPAYKAWIVSTDPINVQFLSAFLCLGLFTSSRIAVQVYAGITAIPKGLPVAAKALGMSVTQTYRYVGLPIAYRFVLPPMTSEAMNIIKNTAVALTIGLPELTLRANEMGENTFQYFAAYIWASVLYVIIGLLVHRVMHFIERKSRIPGFVTHA